MKFTYTVCDSVAILTFTYTMLFTIGWCLSDLLSNHLAHLVKSGNLRMVGKKR